MGRSLQRQSQIKAPDNYDDQRTASEIANSENTSVRLSDFTEAFLSQLKRIIHGDETGNWFDDPVTIFEDDASLLGLLRKLYRPVACLATDSVSDFVCIRGERTNGKWRVEKANPEDETKMPAIGVLVQKSTPTVGIIQVTGPCSLFTGLDYTKPSYILAPTGIQPTLPNPGGNGYIMVQRIGKPVASDVLWLGNDLSMVKRVA